MPNATVVGDSLSFGIAAEESSLTTQSVSVTNKADKKEARDKQGIIVAVAYYNKTTEISIDGLGTFADSSTNIGTALTVSGTFDSASTLYYLDEVSLEQANEEFYKSSLKATAYEGIT
jgi:hypothetical protein